MTSDKRLFISKFEDYFAKHSDDDDYWKSIDEISQITGTTANEVHRKVETYDEFVRNTRGQYTTRKIYEKKAPFAKKLRDQFYNKYL